MELSKIPREKGYSIFGFVAIHNSINFLNSKLIERPREDTKSCKAHLDDVELLGEKKFEMNQYTRVSGWIINEEFTQTS